MGITHSRSRLTKSADVRRIEFSWTADEWAQAERDFVPAQPESEKRRASNSGSGTPRQIPRWTWGGAATPPRREQPTGIRRVVAETDLGIVPSRRGKR